MRYALILLVTSLAISLKGQHHEIPVDKNEHILQQINLKDYGLFLKIGEPSTPFKNTTIKFYFFTSQGSLLWKNEIKSDFYEGSNDFTVASPDDGVIYDLKIKNETLIAHQISKSGNIKTVDLSKYGITKNILNIFCDSEYLYFLNSKSGDEFSKDRKSGERITVHRFSTNDFIHEKMELALPGIENGKNSSFWSFAGQHKESKYLVSKFQDADNNNVYAKIAAFNSDGQVTHTYTLDLPSQGNELADPFFKRKKDQGYYFKDMDFVEVGATQYTYGRLEPRPTAYLSVYLDQDHGAIYLMGVVTKNKEREIVVDKYAMDGNKVWSAKSPIKTSNSAQSLYFSVLPDETINITDQGFSSFSLLEISNKGVASPKQVIDIEFGPASLDATNMSDKYLAGLNNSVFPKSFSYIKSLSSKELKRARFSNTISDSGELLVHYQYNAYVQVRFFKK